MNRYDQNERESNTRQHEHFGCLNLTALLARIERGLLARVQQRMTPAARDRRGYEKRCARNDSA